VSLAEDAVLFYSLPELQEIATHDRLESILQSIAASGSYTHTPAELDAGAQLAWRNQPRCIGRYNWRSLKVIDARSCVTANEVAEACWDHLRISTNRGKLRSVVTIFRPYRGPASHVQILNSQLIRYACYESAGGGIVGDPQQVELTRTAMSLGWRGAGSPFDVLPLIISVDGNPHEMFDIPADHVLEVPIRHPRYPWFSELGPRWHANPAISNMCLEIGGVKYTSAPFSGWYVNPEVGARNLGDAYRYNMLPEIARRMGLDTKRNSTLWRDWALLELNVAVLHSYAEDGVYIVDHHTASAQFLAYVDREEAAGRSVPVDWAWINPPMSACTVGTFHRSFDSPDPATRPAFYRNALFGYRPEAAGQQPA
jgi:nitric-oxide synthase, bacterial